MSLIHGSTVRFMTHKEGQAWNKSPTLGVPSTPVSGVPQPGRPLYHPQNKQTKWLHCNCVTAWPQKSPQINACTAEYPDCFNVSNSVVNPSNLCISTHITWVIWIVNLLPNSVILQDNFEYCTYFVQDIVRVKQYMSYNPRQRCVLNLH